jgi:hypothetical protein
MSLVLHVLFARRVCQVMIDDRSGTHTRAPHQLSGTHQVVSRVNVRELSISTLPWSARPSSRKKAEHGLSFCAYIQPLVAFRLGFFFHLPLKMRRRRIFRDGCQGTVPQRLAAIGRSVVIGSVW